MDKFLKYGLDFFGRKTTLIEFRTEEMKSVGVAEQQISYGDFYESIKELNKREKIYYKISDWLFELLLFIGFSL